MNAPVPPPVVAVRPSATRLASAFAALYLVWGSTYLGMAVAVETMPPFLMASMRFLIAGVLLYGGCRLAGIPAPTLAQWRAAALVGALLFVGGNGVVSWSLRWVPSGVAALLIAGTPLWMAILPWLARRAPRPRAASFAGIAFGIAGVGLLLGMPTGSAPTAMLLTGMLAIVASSVLWATGSLLSKALAAPDSPWMACALQMLCGSIGLGLLSLAAGEPGRFAIDSVSLRSWLAFAYLVLVGAIVGFGAFVYVLRWTTPALASTYAFVNPLVAVALGWLLAGERITTATLLATALIVAAVVVILRSGAPAGGEARR
jgi:drug/metabolite transporter (DMT)-like permease